MRTAIVCLTLVPLALVAPSRAAGDEAGQDRSATLQGAWKLSSVEADGKPTDLPDVSFWWFIQGDKVRYGGQELARLTVDTKTQPSCIDLTFHNPERVYEGIYSVEDDALKICVNRATEGVKERPDAFSTKDKPEWRLLAFKRDKDRKGDEIEGLGGFVGLSLQVAEDDKSLRIAEVLKDGPAMKAGLKKDDVLVRVGNVEATDLRSIVSKIRQAKPGSELLLRVRRDEKDQELKVKVGILPFSLLD
jgi:uncharacterized protein (TIGR03067 family)